MWLKVTPDPQVAAEEAEALAGWERTASVAGLLAADTGAGALLLDGVEPGTPVRGQEWEPAQVAALLRELRESGPDQAPGEGSALRPLAHRVGLLFGLALRRAGPDGPDAEIRLRRARAQALELAASAPGAGLVHGDLHAANVLRGPGGRLVAIDPRPAWGDPDFDAVDWALEGSIRPKPCASGPPSSPGLCRGSTPTGCTPGPTPSAPSSRPPPPAPATTTPVRASCWGWVANPRRRAAPAAPCSPVRPRSSAG